MICSNIGEQIYNRKYLIKTSQNIHDIQELYVEKSLFNVMYDIIIIIRENKQNLKIKFENKIQKEENNYKIENRKQKIGKK